MLIVWFLSIKSLPNLLFGVLCLPGDQSHPFPQPTINPLACCICWTGSLGRAVFPPWNEGPNFGSYINMWLLWHLLEINFGRLNNAPSHQRCPYPKPQNLWTALYGKRDFANVIKNLEIILDCLGRANVIRRGRQEDNLTTEEECQCETWPSIIPQGMEEGSA